MKNFTITIKNSENKVVYEKTFKDIADDNNMTLADVEDANVVCELQGEPWLLHLSAHRRALEKRTFTKEDLNYHVCKDDSWDEYDARGIYLTRVCDVCREVKLATYRPDVLTDANYPATEEIEPEQL